MDTRVKESHLDPVTLEVIRNALPAISNEMAVDLQRTSYNMIIYEVRDFCTALVLPNGELVSQNVGGVSHFMADLGVSSHQFDEAERGFSIRYEADLDMRMDKRQKQTAADVLNTYNESSLQKIFEKYGEVTNAKAISRTIVEARKIKKINTINDFKQIIHPVVKGNPNKYLAQVFQALRIVVNKEIENIQSFLPAAVRSLSSQGRLACISFHSLEDRIVKRYMNGVAGRPVDRPLDVVVGVQSHIVLIKVDGNRFASIHHFCTRDDVFDGGAIPFLPVDVALMHYPSLVEIFEDAADFRQLLSFKGVDNFNFNFPAAEFAEFIGHVADFIAEIFKSGRHVSVEIEAEVTLFSDFFAQFLTGFAEGVAFFFG